MDTQPRARPRNVGGMDAAYRWIIGIMLIMFALLLDAALAWKVAVFALGLAGVVTALRGYCLFNALAGIDTYAERRRAPVRPRAP